MTNESSIHSREVLFQQREVWWNKDFLGLLANRWQLSDCSSLIDIGVGLGSWSRLLMPYLKEPCTITGIDKEDYWISKASDYFFADSPKLEKNQIKLIKADACNLPIDSNIYDVATCQTLLMHLDNPFKALQEMKRVVKKGGIVICVEPINLLNRLEFSSTTPNFDISDQAILFEFWLSLHKGKLRNKLGNNDIGFLLPSLFMQAGFKNIQTYQNDRVLPNLDVSDGSEVEIFISDEDVKYAKAGGADESLIKSARQANTRLTENIMLDIKNKVYIQTGMLNMIICSGTNE